MAFEDSWLDDRDDDECDDDDAITVTSQIAASIPSMASGLLRWPEPASALIGGVEGCRRVSIARPEPQLPTETRVVDPDTGGEKGSKLARFDLIPADPLRQLAEHYGKGAQKYAERNWERGYEWSLTYAALNRHANAFWSGEDIDPDSGSHHMVAVAWHALALVEFARTHKEKDNRPHG